MRPFLRCTFQDVLILEVNVPSKDFISLAPGDDRSQGAFPTPVRPHDGMDFTRLNFQIYSLEDFPAFDAGL